MLDQRRRRWAIIEPTLGQRLVFAGGGGGAARYTPDVYPILV